jgi:general secretion pathway protein G
VTPGIALGVAKWSGAALLIALVAAISVPRFFGVRDLRITKAFIQLDLFRETLAWYRRDHGDFPSTSVGLDALVASSYLDHIPSDPWNNPYVYRYESGSETYQLYSIGVNGVDEHGDGDDVIGPSKHYECKAYGLDCASDKVAAVALLTIVAMGVAGLLGLVISGIKLLLDKMSTVKPAARR